ncbi:MAG: nucleotidyltransferase family protein [Flavobacteriales bacterium]|nr:nucleotidyltransferase family protein [Flavobacteriales bacterium]
MSTSAFSGQSFGNAAVYELLLLASKLHLMENDRAEIVALVSKINHWELFAQRAAGTHLAPILHKNLAAYQEQIPQNALSLLSNSYNQVLVRNIRLYDSFGTMLRKLNTAEIDCVPLKGIYLAEKLYRDLGLRHLSDIDVLIRSKDVDAMLVLMKEDGWWVKKAEPRSRFEKEEFSPAHPYTFFQNGVTVELHTHLYNRNEGAKISEEELWKLTCQENFCLGVIQQFGSEMLLQHLCLHLHKHLDGNELKVLNFCDIHELIETHQTSFDWYYFRTACEKYDCLNKVSEILWICSKHWKTEIPDSFFLNFNTNEALETKFLRFLTGESAKIAQKTQHTVSRSMDQLKQLDGPLSKLTFILGYVFPRPVFMYRNFNLKEGSWLFPWYVLRILILSQKMILASISKIRNQFR